MLTTSYYFRKLWKIKDDPLLMLTYGVRSKVQLAETVGVHGASSTDQKVQSI